MGETTIPWTHKTFSPWHGCVEVSPGCAHCYAKAWDKRLGGNHWGKTRRRRFFGEAYWQQPAKWYRQALRENRRLRVFCASMADVFEDHQGPERWRVDEARQRLWRVIVATAGATPNAPGLDWLLLTKRPENVLRMLPAEFVQRSQSNVWLGFSAETQFWYEVRVAEAARWRQAGWEGIVFVSAEPLLGPLTLETAVGCHLDWLIVGGESGPKARPMDPEWALDLKGEAAKSETAFFFKQLGTRWAKDHGLHDAKGEDPAEFPIGLQVREFPTVMMLA